MNIVGAALPNIMFIVGILAIGLGLGIELKVVSLNKEIDRTGRIGAFVVGILLIGASVAIYLNPSLASRDEGAKPEVNAAQIVAPASQPGATAAPAPTQASVQAAAPVAPTQAPVQAAAPTQAAPGVVVPDIHGMKEPDAQHKLRDAGLNPRKAASCTGADKGDPKPKKDRVACQNPPVGQTVAAGTTVEYVVGGK